ncbi:MAG: OB-fold nucleic acid binding domain-containing protein [Bacteroidota bacterium]
MKGIGEGAVEVIIEERKNNGAYKSIFDLTKRVSSRAANKKVMEGLAYAGAFDCFQNSHRAQYFFQKNGEEGNSALELAIRLGNAFQERNDTSQQSLFGEESGIELKEPVLPECNEWSRLERVSKEKEVTGLYISGHPLDDFKFEIKNFCSHNTMQLKEFEKLKNQEISIAGIVTESLSKITKTGKPYGAFTLEDYSGSTSIMVFSEDYMRVHHLLKKNNFLYVRGRVQLRYNSTDQLEFKPSIIILLSDVCDKYVNSITLKVPSQIVSDELIHRIKQLVIKNPGRCKLKFVIDDNEEKFSLEMFSSLFKINPNREFFSAVDEIDNLKYTLN